jgi:hypothetical protein
MSFDHQGIQSGMTPMMHGAPAMRGIPDNEDDGSDNVHISASKDDNNTLDAMGEKLDLKFDSSMSPDTKAKLIQTVAADKASDVADYLGDSKNLSALKALNNHGDGFVENLAQTTQDALDNSGGKQKDIDKQNKDLSSLLGNLQGQDPQNADGSNPDGAHIIKGMGQGQDPELDRGHGPVMLQRTVIHHVMGGGGEGGQVMADNDSGDGGGPEDGPQGQ